MDYIEKTIQAYDAAPDKYASATGSMVNEPEMDLMLRLMPQGEKRILDVGSGPGRDAHVFSQKGYFVTGIDMSKELIKRARQAYPNLTFSQMDVRNIEFPATTFGAVWCNAVLLHLKDADLAKAFKEIYRVLKPQGVVAMSFKKGAGEKEVLETFSTDLSRFYNFKTLDTLKPLLETCNFQIVDSYVLNERERFGPDKRDLDWVWVFAKRP